MIGAGDVIRRVIKKRSPGCTVGAPAYRKGLFPLLWIMLTVFIFSFSNLKKNMYLLPMMPGVVLLCVQGVSTLSAYMRLRRLRGIAVIIQIGMAVAALVIACIGMRSMASLFITLPAIALAIFAVASAWNRDIHRWLIFQSAAGALAVTAFLVYHMGEKDNLRSARPVATAVMPLLGEPDIAFHNIPIEVSVYLPLNLPERASAPRQLIFTRAAARRAGCVSEPDAGPANCESGAAAFCEYPEGESVESGDSHGGAELKLNLQKTMEICNYTKAHGWLSVGFRNFV